MLTDPLAPYLLWAKSRTPCGIDLAGSNLLPCTIADLPGAADALALSAPNDNGYAPLVEAIAAHYGVATGRIATAMGCSGANFLVMAALVAAGDEVLIERPTYDPLIGAARLMGARVTRFERRFEDGYQVDVEAIGRALSTHTRLVVLTSPHNPSGAMIPSADLEAIGARAADVGAAVLVDEVYLDAARRISGPSGLASAASLSGPFVTTSSLTKSFGLAGLRCGWAIAAPTVAERLRRTRDVVDNAGSGPADRLAALAFTHLPSLLERAGRILGRNVALMRAFLGDHPALEVAAPPAASVVFPRFVDRRPADEFVTRMARDHDVAVASGTFFEAPAHFRMSLAGDPDRLAEGLARMDAELRYRAGGFCSTC